MDSDCQPSGEETSFESHKTVFPCMILITAVRWWSMVGVGMQDGDEKCQVEG